MRELVVGLEGGEAGGDDEGQQRRGVLPQPAVEGVHTGLHARCQLAAAAARVVQAAAHVQRRRWRKNLYVYIYIYKYIYIDR